MADILKALQSVEQEVTSSFSGHKSTWTLKTSGTANLGLGYVVVGGGLSVGIPKLLSGLAKAGKFLRLARIIKSIDPADVAGKRSTGVAPESFPNHGIVLCCPAARTRTSPRPT